jgi:hypothetical protein
MHDKVGFMAELTEGFCQKAKVAMPKELVGVNSQVGVEEDFQGIGWLMKAYARMITKLSQSDGNKDIY